MAYQIRPYREKDFDEVISLLVDCYRKFKKGF